MARSYFAKNVETFQVTLTIQFDSTDAGALFLIYVSLWNIGDINIVILHILMGMVRLFIITTAVMRVNILVSCEMQDHDFLIL